MQKIILTLLCALTLAGKATASDTHAISPASAPEDAHSIWGITYENDIFANTDRGYTSGVRLNYLSPETQTPEWVKWTSRHVLPALEDGKHRYSVAVGQSMFTPANLTQSAPIATDRPYAGWLYGSVGVVTDNGTKLDNLMLTIGIVGPYSQAEETQKFIHSHFTDSPTPRGWDNQLKTEPGIMLTYERKWRSFYKFSPFGTGMDFTPAAGVNLGNIETDAIAGSIVRMGYNLPEDYGPPRVRPSLPGSDFFIPTQDFGGYLFGGLEGRAVARNIFLDGNTFATSQHVNKNPFVGSAQLGMALTYGSARLSYTQVFLTREFESQISPEQFGVVTLSLRF